MLFNTQIIDRLAISLSGLCVAHCLLFPILGALIPSFVSLGLTSESFHFWMVASVLPTSIYALALGCKKHAQFSVFFLGLLGLCSLVLALTLGHDLLGELGEKVLTLIGALFIAFAHVKNFKLCQQQRNCSCESEEN